MTGGISEIPIPEAGLCIGADLFRQYRRGEIDHDTYCFLNASLVVAPGAEEEKPHLYRPIQTGIVDYLNSRLQGGEYNQPWSKKLGDWRYDVYQALDHNLYMIDHFKWAIGKCETKDARGEIEQLKTAISRFERVVFPSQIYLNVCRVQSMDSAHRERERRGR